MRTFIFQQRHSLCLSSPPHNCCSLQFVFFLLPRLEIFVCFVVDGIQNCEKCRKLLFEGRIVWPTGMKCEVPEANSLKKINWRYINYFENNKIRVSSWKLFRIKVHFCPVSDFKSTNVASYRNRLPLENYLRIEVRFHLENDIESKSVFLILASSYIWHRSLALYMESDFESKSVFV